MNYQTFEPHSDLSALVNLFWTLEIPFTPTIQKQKIIPDGHIEMTFNLKDKLKRYVSEKEYIIPPVSKILGQRTKAYYIEPMGNVQIFGVCFYPHGFANFINYPLEKLVDKSVTIASLFGKEKADHLEHNMIEAESTASRIKLVETFLLDRLKQKGTINRLVKSTVDSLLETNGSAAIGQLLKSNLSQRRQLERNFRKQIGISPKKLGKVLRLQSALKNMLNGNQNLTNIAYSSKYYDQTHFVKDFKELVGTTPKEFLGNQHLALSSLFYQ